MTHPRHLLQSVVCILLAGAAVPAVAQAAQAESTEVSAADTDVGTVSYPATFFLPYNPVTANDMIQQVPGFSLDTGGNARGFGGTAGNVLINGSRPSTKNDDAGEILSRIPASQVLAIDLIRGNTGGLNLRGQTIVANVLLRPDALPATRWDARARITENTSTVNPQGSVSGTRYAGPTRLTMGIEGGEERSQQARGNEWLHTPDGIAEQRHEVADSGARGYALNLNTETRLPDLVLHSNVRVGTRRTLNTEESVRVARSPGFMSRTVREDSGGDNDTLELGGDAEFTTGTLAMKAIAVYNRNEADYRSMLRVTDARSLAETLSRSDQLTVRDELVGRLELDWTGFTGHRLELNLEGARNVLDSRLRLVQDNGPGPVVVPVPGANTQVEELRWELDIADSWNAGSLAIETGLALETSTIEQRGDAARKRSFTFLKPRLLVSHAPGPGRQWRLRVLREVSQLDFREFASSTNFADNQLALGNPELKPDNTWVVELGWERRFGEIGVLGFTAFHHWIDDVRDILPLGGVLETPGNIGNGRRWGVEPMLTMSLAWLGIDGVRIDLRGRWQDSAVTDPVTGRTRRLSNELRHEFRLDFRHNIPGTTVSWGGMVATASETPFYGLDEQVLTDDIANTVDMDVFVETTRWFGLRTRLQAGNIFNRSFVRDRRVWGGPRELSPLAFQELRSRTRGHSIEVSVTGSF